MCMGSIVEVTFDLLRSTPVCGNRSVPVVVRSSYDLINYLSLPIGRVRNIRRRLKYRDTKGYLMLAAFLFHGASSCVTVDTKQRKLVLLSWSFCHAGSQRMAGKQKLKPLLRGLQHDV